MACCKVVRLVNALPALKHVAPELVVQTHFGDRDQDFDDLAALMSCSVIPKVDQEMLLCRGQNMQGNISTVHAKECVTLMLKKADTLVCAITVKQCKNSGVIEV
jgi:hypothetical protein